MKFDIKNEILQKVFLDIIQHHEASDSTEIVKAIFGELKINSENLLGVEQEKIEEILNSCNSKKPKEDTLGFAYQSIRNQTNRKEAGQYYTPNKVADFIIKNVGINLTKNPNSIILDPACGSGQFLLSAYDKLLQSYRKTGMSQEEAHKTIIEQHLFGIDIDPIACALTKANLYLRCPHVTDIKFNIFNTDFLKKDNATIKSDLFKINFIIGNPPWGAKLSSEQKKYFKKCYEIGKGGLNTFTLFIERALDFMQENSRLGFLIPEAYLKIKTHEQSRLQLLRNGKIKLLATGGELFKNVYAPSLILIFEKTKSNTNNKVLIKENAFNGDGIERRMPQSLFDSTTEHIFNIHIADAVTREILKHVDSLGCKFLKDHGLFILGIVTGNNKKHLVKKPLTPNHSPIILGRDLRKYKIGFSDNYFVYDKETLQQVAPKEHYEVPEKLIYKFIGKDLVFAYDNKKRFILNNANAMVPKIPGLDIKYILGVLNSKLIQFYYSKMFFTVRVLRGNLERLPIFNANKDEQKEIIELVGMIEEAQNIKEYETLTKRIDDEIFDLYKIKNEWRNHISSNYSYS